MPPESALGVTGGHLALQEMTPTQRLVGHREPNFVHGVSTLANHNLCNQSLNMADDGFSQYD